MLLSVTSRNVLLPDFDLPRPATINVDLRTGKIIEVLLRYIGDEACNKSGDLHFVDAGDKVVLPGLVEWGSFLVAKTGKAFGPAHKLLLLEALPL